MSLECAQEVAFNLNVHDHLFKLKELHLFGEKETKLNDQVGECSCTV